jgi:hypothetical protein
MGVIETIILPNLVGLKDSEQSLDLLGLLDDTSPAGVSLVLAQLAVEHMDHCGQVR